MNFPETTLWLIDLFFRPTDEEVERATNYLVDNFGTDASAEAERLSDVCRRIGARQNARVYSTVARRLADARGSASRRPESENA
jgi:hypothetical protein